MKATWKILLGVMVLLIPTLIIAQSGSGSGKELDDDSNRILVDADKKLNAAYQRLVTSIRNEGTPNADLDLESLRDSQRAWLKYRDAQVAFVGTHADIGSSSARAAGMATYSVQLTNERIKDLDDVPNPF